MKKTILLLLMAVCCLFFAGCRNYECMDAITNDICVEQGYAYGESEFLGTQKVASCYANKRDMNPTVHLRVFDEDFKRCD